MKIYKKIDFSTFSKTLAICNLRLRKARELILYFFETWEPPLSNKKKFGKNYQLIKFPERFEIFQILKFSIFCQILKFSIFCQFL